LQDAAAVAGVVEQQFGAIADVRSAAAFALQRIDSDFRALADDCRLDLANLGREAHALAARRPLGIVAEAVRAVGMATAEAMDAVFDEAIAARRITLEDCFDTDYRELTGAAIAELGRLFDVSRVPAEGFLPKKYATRYDRFVEDGIDALIDANVSQHPAIKAMFAVDLNGYCFAHYRDCRRAWTGEYTTDLTTNRIKRFFDDELSLRCSRNGLGPAADGLPPRTPRAVFAAHGCTLTRTDVRPWAIYTYARDTGIVYNDLSVGLFARDQRVGTIRIIYDADVV
jgi:methyl-accepting chemotaxis protein